MFGHGWCELHYDRWRRQGDPNAVLLLRGDPVHRFWQHVDIGYPDECWPWTSTTTREGYGVMSLGGGQVKAHRFAYELLLAPIGRGLDLDHICHNADLTCTDPAACPHRRCVNPLHLDPVSSAINAARSQLHRRTALRA